MNRLPVALQHHVFSYTPMTNNMFMVCKDWKRLLTSERIYYTAGLTREEKNQLKNQLCRLFTNNRHINIGRLAHLCFHAQSTDLNVYHPTINLLSPEEREERCTLIKPYIVTPFNFEKEVPLELASREFHTYSDRDTKEWMRFHQHFNDTAVTVKDIKDIIGDVPFESLFVRKIISFFILTNTALNRSTHSKDIDSYAYTYTSDLRLGPRIRVLNTHLAKICALFQVRYFNCFSFMDIAIIVLGFIYIGIIYIYMSK